MTTEKRGSEKLLQTEGDLSALTPEELEQVAGGAAHSSILALKDYFPIGILPPDIWKDKIDFNRFDKPGLGKEQFDIPRGR